MDAELDRSQDRCQSSEKITDDALFLGGIYRVAVLCYI